MNTIYLFSGIGCSRAVFDRLTFPPGYRVRHVSWQEPRQGEGLREYCARLVSSVVFDGSDVLVGVSFGGMAAMEVARAHPQVEKVILLSSAVDVSEYAGVFRWYGALKLYGVTPGRLFLGRRLRAWLVTGRIRRRDAEAAERFFAPLSARYFRFAVRACLTFEGADRALLRRIWRIHGHRDALFPVRRLVSPAEDVDGATHLMVYTHGREVSRLLDRIIRGRGCRSGW